MRFQKDRSFYMITTPPTDGCKMMDNATEYASNSFHPPTCNDSDVISYKRLLPVYSKHDGSIYKNPQCASCHGQYDVTVWKGYVFCPELFPFSNDMESCSFHFVYPGDESDIQHLECFTDTFSTCPAEFSIVLQLDDLTNNEIAEACSWDNLPRFVNGFFAKNLFCFMCHYCRHKTDCFEKCVFPTSLTINKAPGQRVFTRIIDTRLVALRSNSNAGHLKGNTICGLDENPEVISFLTYSKYRFKSSIYVYCLNAC